MVDPVLEVNDSGLRSRIAYLADCWRADIGRGEVVDLFGSRVDRVRLSLRDPFLGLSSARLALGREDPFLIAATLAEREKQPLLFAFVVVAGAAPGQRQTRVAAPLLVWPARAEGTDGELVAQRERPEVNATALGVILGDESLGSVAAAAVEAALVAVPWGAGTVFALSQVLETVLPGCDTSGLGAFTGALLDTAALREARNAAEPGTAPRVLAAAGALLITRSLGSRGVDHELTRLARGEIALSPPLRQLLGGPAAPMGKARTNKVRSPAVLSLAQRRAVAAAARFDLSLLVGPPGTGKSFTIAAIALDAVARGESVLLASSRDQALDVLEHKGAELAGGSLVVLRAGRGETARALVSTLEGFLHGDYGALGEASQVGAARLGGLLHQAERALARHERQLEAATTLEGSLGRPQLGRMDRWRELWASFRSRRRVPLWRRYEAWEQALVALGPATAEWLRVSRRERLERLLRRRRDDIVALTRALKARRSSDQERWFAELDRDTLRGAFPLWSTTFADAHRALPLEPDLFDLVIIDEATQCDAATALPILARGRRALVTGDPRQLRHVSFLAEVQRQELGAHHGLGPADLDRFDYRNRSLLDLVSDAVASGDGVARLDEHFRSAPAIIEFSNREFYGGRLAVMTRRPATLERAALRLERVVGQRGEDGINRAEVERVVAVVRELVVASANQPRPPSLGVASPFRDQTDALAEALGQALDATTIARHRLLVGTAWGFQGEERDVMVLSLAVDEASARASWRYLVRDDVFNVAVTRARNLQVVVTSVSGRGDSSLLGRYLAYIEGHQLGVEAAPASGFVAEVAAACRQQGWSVWPHFEVAGTVVDLLVADGATNLAVDLVGGPDGTAAGVEIDRARMLARAGLPLFVVPWLAWQERREAVREALADRLRMVDALGRLW